MTTESTVQTNFEQLKKQLNGDSSEAAKQAEKTAIELAEQGSMEAAELLSSLYADGTAVIPRDRVREFRYTKKAAELGSGFSRAWLAHIQRESGDLAGALENARLAHEMGVSFGTNLLATMMLAGEGQSANPLEALQLLSEDLERSSTNTDGAVILAQVYLEGKYFAKNPQKAYDTLHGFSKMAGSVTRHIDPPQYGNYLYLKAQAITLGATPADNESADELLARAAEYGCTDAAGMKQQKADEAAAAELRRQWEAIAYFKAFGGKWQMFYKFGRLERSEANGPARVLALRGRDGERFEVNAFASTRVAIGQDCVVVYIGPEKQGDGLPCLVVDLKSGKVFQTMANITIGYRENVSKLPLLMAFVMGGLSVLFFNIGGFMTLLTGAACAFGAFKCFKTHLGDYKKALRDAREFVTRHRAAFA
jgi:TPR repeat protein